MTENTGRINVVAARLEIAPFDFDAGDRPLDSYVDMPPYLNEPHLKLALEGYSSTSIGLDHQEAGVSEPVRTRHVISIVAKER